MNNAVSRQLDIEKLQRLLDTYYFGIGDRLVYLPVVDSTNTYAMMLAQNGSEEGVVVLTDSQAAGKGRQGRRWVDVAGCNALSSTVLRPLFPPYLLVMVASLALVDTIAATCDVATTIKWPNDILVGRRKIAGILIETSRDQAGRLVAILGIGVNVNGRIAQLVENASRLSQTTNELAEIATTLEEVCGHTVSREALIATQLQQIEHYYLALQQEAQSPATSTANQPFSRLVREKWRDRLSTLGRTIEVRQGNKLLSGVAEDVNENGELLLRTHLGEHISITWGDVG